MSEYLERQREFNRSQQALRRMREIQSIENGNFRIIEADRLTLESIGRSLSLLALRVRSGLRRDSN